MSRKIIDLATHRAQPDRAGHDREKSKEAERARTERLAEAPDIAAQLRQKSKTAPSDRAIFAHNLARMCREALRSDTQSHRKVFQMAFGANFDAKYKKRKRLICAEDEAPPKKEFVAHGADFLSLAEAVAKIAHAGQPADALIQARHRAILQLVAGSSFDDRRTPDARRKDEAVASLLDCLDQMLRNVEAEVDLDAMRAVIHHDAVSAIIDRNGTVERLVATESRDSQGDLPQRAGESDEAFDRRRTAHRREQLPPAQRALLEALESDATTRDDGAIHRGFSAWEHMKLRWPNETPVRLWGSDLDDPGNPMGTVNDSASPFAPRVLLGEVYSPADLAGAVMLEINEAEIAAAVARSERDYADAVARYGLAATAPAFDRDRASRDLLEKAAVKALAAAYGYSDAWVAEECQGLPDLAERICDDGFAPPTDPWGEIEAHGIVARRQIELKLLRDVATERWRLCLSLSHGVGSLVFGREGVYGIQGTDTPFASSACLGSGELPMPLSSDMGTLFLHRAGDNRFLLYAVENEDCPAAEVLGVRMGWLSAHSGPALDAFFSTVGDKRIQAPLDRFWNEPAPAEAGTLAGLILRNLAYAPDNERYDLLLLEDAKAKANMARAFAENSRQRFDAAIERLRQ